MNRWKTALAGALGAALLCSLSQLHAAAWPDRMNYQGQLTNLAGDAVADGSYNLTFSLWDNAIAIPVTGTKVWGDETHAVTVSKGLFNVILGSNGAPLSTLTPLLWSSDLYLQIVVSGTDTLNPRQPIIHSNNAHRLQGLVPNNSANNLVVLDGSGKIPAGLVQGSSLSLPFDMTGAGGAYNLKVNNNSAAPGDKGVWAIGSPALRAEANTVAGDAIVAVTDASDNSLANAVRATANNGIGVLAQSTNYIGLVAQSTNHIGISVTSASNYAIYADGYSGSFFKPGYIWGSAISGHSNTGDSQGYLGDGNYSAGVRGYNSSGGYGVFGESNSGVGGYFYSAGGFGVYGYSSSSWGGYFYGQNGIQVDGGSTYGIYSHGPSYGVYAYSENIGVYAYSNSGSGYGIQGDNSTGGASSAGIYGNGYTGVWGNSTFNNGRGVYGVATQASGIGVAGEHSATTGVAVQGLNTNTGIGSANAMGVRGE